MKIKKIKKIKNLATFNYFQWQDNCQEFSRYNFFYGWNYSGKTTLSRIFRCLEIKTKHSDFPNAEFSIETDNVNITQQDIFRDYPIRTFNEEFVEDNFQWNNEKAEIDPVLILGKEAKDLEVKAKEFSKSKNEKEGFLEESRKEKETIERNLDNSLTERASEIRNILGVANPKEFDKNKLDEKINLIQNSYPDYILTNNEKEKILDVYRSKKAEDITFEAPRLRLSTYISEVKSILSQEVTAQQIIEKLKANQKLSGWVREGIELHQNEKLCQFCGNSLPADLFERLKKHFSYEFDNLMKQINSKENEILNHIKEIENLNFPDRARLFEDLQTKFKNKLNFLNTLKNNYISVLQSLREELNRKKESPFDSLKLKKLHDDITELASAIEDVEQIINEHNLKVDSFENEKQKAREKLINYFTAKFIKEKNYPKDKRKIEEFKKFIRTCFWIPRV